MLSSTCIWPADFTPHHDLSDLEMSIIDGKAVPLVEGGLKSGGAEDDLRKTLHAAFTEVDNALSARQEPSFACIGNETSITLARYGIYVSAGLSADRRDATPHL